MLFLRGFAHDENLFRFQAYRGVHAYVFGAAVSRVYCNAMILKFKVMKLEVFGEKEWGGLLE